MADDWKRRYFTSGINPFADESIDMDEALRRKAVMEGVEEPSLDDVTYLETQEMADERVKKGMEQSMVEPLSGDMDYGQKMIEQRAQAQFPSETMPVGEKDVAAEQAEVAKASLDKPVDPSQTNALNTTLTAEDSKLKQEELLRTSDPIAYVRKKYGLAPDAQRDEMMADTDYESLKSMQRRTGIMDALSDVDKSIGSLGDWNLLEAKRAGYTGSYEGGALGKLAARKKAEFQEKSKFRDTDLERQKTGMGLEKSSFDLASGQRKLALELEDEQAMRDPSSLISQVYRETAKRLKLDVPDSATAKSLEKVLGFLKERVQSASLKNDTFFDPKTNEYFEAVYDPTSPSQLTRVGGGPISPEQANRLLKGFKPDVRTTDEGLVSVGPTGARVVDSSKRTPVNEMSAEERQSFNPDKGQRRSIDDSVKRLDKITEVQRKQMQALRDAQELIKQAKAGNKLAKKNLEKKIPRIAGEVGNLAVYEQQGVATSEALIDQIEQFLSTMASGELTESNIKEVEKLIAGYENAARSTSDRIYSTMENYMAGQGVPSEYMQRYVRPMYTVPDTTKSQQPTEGKKPASIRIKRKSDGAVRVVPADRAAKFLNDPNFEEVK